MTGKKLFEDSWNQETGSSFRYIRRKRTNLRQFRAESCLVYMDMTYFHRIGGNKNIPGIVRFLWYRTMHKKMSQIDPISQKHGVIKKVIHRLFTTKAEFSPLTTRILQMDAILDKAFIEVK